jgi:hypothetical protein
VNSNAGNDQAVPEQGQGHEDSGEKAAGPQGTMFFRTGELPDGQAEESEAQSGQPALIGLTAPFAQKQFGLSPGRTTIGRKTDNDISLNESSVSSTHARIIHEKGQWRILNLLSTNGTFVNGRKVTEAVLQHGDKVRLGRAEFAFRCSDKPLPDTKPSSSAGRSPVVLVAMLLLAAAAAGLTWWLW